MNTTTTNLLLNAYTVQTATPTFGSRSITGEFVITGKRGATYRTYRPWTLDNDSNARVQFIAESGKFCALLGNYSLPLELVAKCAVTFTDADRI